jgi:pimeloyl-ACP methyl ester carboxylesterase
MQILVCHLVSSTKM